jgi:prepilin-type N-terminal cleavage/methylation domain-containing protein
MMQEIIGNLKRNKSDIDLSGSRREGAFTLIELIASMAIMGMILFVVNVVLISVMKSSARTDTTIRMGNYIETGFEIIERNVKSSEPSSLCIAEYNEAIPEWECTDEVTGDALMMNLLSDLKTTVIFYFEENENEVGILKSYWIKYNASGDDESRIVTYLSSSSEIDVVEFQVDIAFDDNTGTNQVILRTLCDSIDSIGMDDPLVDDMLRSVTIVSRGSSI